MKKILITLILAALVVAPASALVPFSETSVNQMKLAVDADFIARLQFNLDTQARVVLAETGIGSTHTRRAIYAANVVNSPESFARVAAVMIVGGVNLIGTVTIDGTGKASTSVTDAALLSQIATYWNAVAGVDSGS